MLTPQVLEALDLSTFIAFDLETTGLDPFENEIIEFAGVKYSNGRIVDRLEFLIKPEKNVPAEIQELTGITDEMLKDKADISDRLPLILEFIQDFPLVAHNIKFDLSFLQSAIVNTSNYYHVLENTLYDTLTLSRMFFFYLPEFRLGPLMEQFGISREGAHRAAKDAEDVGELFLRCIERALEYDLETYQYINRILRETEEPNKQLFITIANYLIKTKRIHTSRKRLQQLWSSRPNIRGEKINRKDLEQKDQILSGDIESLFTDGALLSSRIESYEFRPEQIKMAEAVEDTFLKSEVLVVEAGTGVGKSLAYLIPVYRYLYRSEDEDTRFIISSYTRNLQEQLFNKEIPFIHEELGWNAKVVLLKGRNNYICLTRWNRLLQNVENYLKPVERVKILPIIIWLKHTTTGDISECNGFNQDYSPRLWRLICSESGYCTTRVCGDYHGCFLGKLRREAHTADIIIVNHALLLSSISTDLSSLPEFTHLIVDEAHNLEKYAYKFLAREFSYWSFHNLLMELYSPGRRTSGILIDLKRFLQNYGDEYKTLVSILDSAIDTARQLQRLLQELFAAISSTIEGSKEEFAYVFKKRFKAEDNPLDKYEELLAPFVGELEQLLEYLKILKEELPRVGQQRILEDNKILVQLDMNRNELLQALRDVEILYEADREELVYWYEISKEKELNVYFYYTFLNIDEVLYNKLFKECKSLILTSATLRIADSFEYILGQLGISHLETDRINTLVLGSPFCYQEQVRFFIIDHPYNVNSENFFDYLARTIQMLSLRYQRGTLILFTSYKALIETFTRCKKLLGDRVLLLRQSRAISRRDLLEIFKKKKSSILFGTDSFWEGIDVIGDALEILIITKLPFAVPTEPIVQANMERFSREGKNPFIHYNVPEAVLKFRQGFGRLIRSQKDRGIFICFDTRIYNKDYGRLFQESLPVKLEVMESLDLLEVEAGRFFGGNYK